MRRALTIIICTYRRADDLERLLGCLVDQTQPDAEVLIVDGSGTDSAVRDRVAAFQGRPKMPIRLIQTSPGLTRQRNVGLAAAEGELVGFLDDDVTIDRDFVRRVISTMAEPGMRDVGGITGFDTSYYPQPITFSWRLRHWLGVVPGLVPGAVDHLGRRVPVEFAGPAPVRLDVGWLPGFCMIYRREAVSGLRFDEHLPTYAGEDKEFSLEVGQRWRLTLCADVTLVHHRSTAARDDEVDRTWQIGYGMGRGFARRARGAADYLRVTRYALGETIILFLRFLHRPGLARLRVVGAMPRGLAAGFASVSRGEVK